jgi:hypothetical protein
MPRLTLDFIEDYPYIVLGISTSERDYRITWHINKSLNIQLSMEAPIEVIQKKGVRSLHSYFSYMDTSAEVRYRLLQNKSARGMLLPEAEKADFLLVVDDNCTESPAHLIGQLKQIKPVLLAFEVDLDPLKNKQNLLLTA